MFSVTLYRPRGSLNWPRFTRDEKSPSGFVAQPFATPHTCDRGNGSPAPHSGGKGDRVTLVGPVRCGSKVFGQKGIMREATTSPLPLRIVIRRKCRRPTQPATVQFGSRRDTGPFGVLMTCIARTGLA